MRFGLVGTGYWAETVHGPGVAQHPDAELVGVWGRDPAKAARLATQLDAAPYDDVERMLSDVDALAFALPPDVQAPIAILAARAGRHLLLEKPIALSVEEAHELEQAALDGRVASVVFFTARFAERTAAWTAHVASQDGWECGRAEWATRAEGGPFGNSPWRYEKGGLWDVGPHALAVLTGVLGDVVEVVASGGIRDQVHIALRHAGGASSTASLSLTVPEPAVGVSWYFYGTPGRETGPEDSTPTEVSYAAAIDALVAQVVRGEPGHPCDVRLGARVVEILAAAEQSLATRAAVTLPRR
jgi:predicted dehydrogenase